jgi:hypothetical protein
MEVFLSYAKEDQAAAEELVTWFRGQGIEPFWWQDERQRGGRFITKIEDAIGSVDLFVVLMSPDYLTSRWCRDESQLAMQREKDSGGDGFVRVITVARTPRAGAGFLRNRDWLDLTPPRGPAKLAAIAAALGQAHSLPAAHRPPVFRNRDDELNTIVTALAVTGGRDLWVVISPPRMGKSWFLAQLAKDVSSRVANCSVRLLDVQGSPLELRGDPVRLLGALLDLGEPLIPPTGPLSALALRRVAAAVSRRDRPEVYLLDSADLLDPVCAKQLRAFLTVIYNSIPLAGRAHSRFSVVVGTRRHDEWKGLGGGITGQRFHPVALTEFGVDVVHQALAELPRTFDPGRLRDCAMRLHRLSEGLPALLVRGLRWAEDGEFLDLDSSDGDETFDEVARPYIRDDLLSADSLLPLGGENLVRAKALLERALRVLVAYRLFTQSHLRYHVAADDGFRAALHEAGWTLDDLWKAVSRTALLKRPLEEPWQLIEPPIRRLLYRYYYGTEQARCAAHATARLFYEGWTDKNAGKEQGVVLVECLWHEASRRVIDRPTTMAAELPEVAAALAADFVNSPIYESVEFSEFVAMRLREDEEFQLVLHEFDGLFERVSDRVVSTIAGGM